MDSGSLAKLFNNPIPTVTRQITGVNTDSRTIAAGNCFVALTGPNYDGHNFVQQAADRGAAVAIVTHTQPVDILQIEVSDTLAALGQLAKHWRQQFSMPLLGVTGSCGKTTTKSMLQQILEGQGPTLATVGTLNNQIGLPLTLLKLQPEHKFAVIEMGADHVGEIATLAAIALPKVTVITNARPVHLQGFIDLEGVARGKGEIYAALPEDGVAVINAEEDFYNYWRDIAGSRRIISFGLQQNADVHARDIQVDTFGAPSFTLHYKGESAPVKLQLLGEHNVLNALAAAGCAFAVGCSVAAVAAGLNATQSVTKRMQLRSGLAGARVIDDTYNANPAATESALQILARYTGERVFVFGGMAELGANSLQYHQGIGDFARSQGIQRVLTVGDLAAATAHNFGQGSEHFVNKQELALRLRELMHKEMVVLVKGSRSAKMEEIVANISE